MLRNISAWQVAIIVIALVVVLGWKRLPDMARSLGQSMRIFKSEVEQLSDKDAPSAASGDTVRGDATDAEPAPGNAPHGSTPHRSAQHDPPRDEDRPRP